MDKDYCGAYLPYSYSDVALRFDMSSMVSAFNQKVSQVMILEGFLPTHPLINTQKNPGLRMFHFGTSGAEHVNYITCLQFKNLVLCVQLNGAFSGQE